MRGFHVGVEVGVEVGLFGGVHSGVYNSLAVVNLQGGRRSTTARGTTTDTTSP